MRDRNSASARALAATGVIALIVAIAARLFARRAFVPAFNPAGGNPAAE